MPMQEKVQKPICKICPKKKKEPSLKEEVTSEAEEELVLPFEEAEEFEEEDEKELPCEDEESCKDFASAGYVLQDIASHERKKVTSFYSSAAPKSRYENVMPVDVANEHQYEAFIQKTVIDHMCSLKVTSEPHFMRQTAIVATIGPSCMRVQDIEELLLSGVNIARLNMAYGDRCCQLTAIHNFKTAVKNYHGRIGLNIPVALLMDLKGPEIRTGRICRIYACNPENPQVTIEKNSVVKLTTELAYADKCTPNLIFIDFYEFTEFIRPGMKMYIDDGSIQLIVQKVSGQEAVAKVETGGPLGNYRPVHVPMVHMPVTGLTNVDEEDIELAVEEDFDFVVLSKVVNAENIEAFKKKLLQTLLVTRKLKETSIMVLVKISNFQALTNIDAIIKASDGIVIQRVDLSLELAPEKVYVAQREIIAKCNLANKPVICCSQLMKSMADRLLVHNSHIFDVAACIEHGADCVCLTAETAIGEYPIETVEQTNYILKEVEAAVAKKHHFMEISEKLNPPIEPIIAIGMAACIVAEKINATSIVVLTTSGRSAQIISWFRPRCAVIAITRFEKTARQLHVWRSVIPLIYKAPCDRKNWFNDLDLRFQFGIHFGKQVGLIRAGDPVVFISGYGKSTGFTNCLRIVYVSTEPTLFNHNKDASDRF